MAFRKLSDFSSSGLLAGGRTPAERWRPPEHVAGFSEITGVPIVCPQIEEISLTLAMTQAGVVNSNAGCEHLLEVAFEGGHQASRVDFQPDLPFVFRW